MADCSLDKIQVASPCEVSWDQMRGNDRVRWCRECGLNVFNLSALSREDTEALIQNSEGRLCVRFYRRADDTLLTRDCPVGVYHAMRRRTLRMLTVGAFTSILLAATDNPITNVLRNYEPCATILNWIAPQRFVMGVAALPPQPTGTSSPK